MTASARFGAEVDRGGATFGLNIASLSFAIFRQLTI
jgi:hypothetical protein